jgi:hypothetical protein
VNRSKIGENRTKPAREKENHYPPCEPAHHIHDAALHRVNRYNPNLNVTNPEAQNIMGFEPGWPWLLHPLGRAAMLQRQLLREKRPAIAIKPIPVVLLLQILMGNTYTKKILGVCKIYIYILTIYKSVIVSSNLL